MRHFMNLLLMCLLLVACTGKQQQENSTANETIVEPSSKPADMPVAELVLDAQAKLGEGAIWHPELEKFFWIDIEGQKLHAFDPATSTDREYEMGQRIGTVVPMQSGNVAVALQDGIYTVDLETGELALFSNPLEGQENIRFNDGKCSPEGRFWVGSMALNGGKHAAALYRVEPDGTYQQMVDSVTISNGIVWSLDGSKMYYIDTPTRKLTVYDYDQATGDIGNPRVGVEFPEETGSPDGMAIDAEGMVWVGMWGGSAVTRWNPETGEYLGKIAVPAKNVTACAFGGDNLETLYITTASVGTSEEEKEKFPQAGGVFAARPGVKGTKAFFFAR